MEDYIAELCHHSTIFIDEDSEVYTKKLTYNKGEQFYVPVNI